MVVIISEYITWCTVLVLCQTSSKPSPDMLQTVWKLQVSWLSALNPFYGHYVAATAVFYFLAVKYKNKTAQSFTLYLTKQAIYFILSDMNL